jgi:iron-sulfur cluster repair protein YtfE (RIC family)
MTTNQTTLMDVTPDALAGWLIRDLVDRYPETMAALEPYGIDLCCGGGRPLGEPLELHGAPVQETLETIAAIAARHERASERPA